MTITTTGSGFETLLGVYTGTTLPGLVAVQTNHTAGNGMSTVTFSAVANTTYQIAIDGAVGGTDQAALEISLGTSLATITHQPADTGVATGQTMSFNTVASAAGMLTVNYQWYQSGILLVDGPQTVAPIAGEIISGATTPTLTASNVVNSSSGTNVYVVITNSDGSGSAASSPAVFTVFYGSPYIDTDPLPSTVNAGGTAIFTATSEGGPLPDFQWRKGGVPLVPGVQASGSTVSISNLYTVGAGNTTSTLTITNANNASGGDAGSYDVVASNHSSDNTLNTATSAAAALTIIKANQAAPVIYATGSMTFGSLYTATTNVGKGAAVWSLGTGSTAAGPAVGASTGVVTSTGLGTVVIRAQFAGDVNYNASGFTPLTVTVSAAPTTFALNSTSFTYTGSAQGPTINPTPSAATFTQGGTLSATAAGSYTATATATGLYTGTNSSLGWTINKATATVALGSLSTTYNGSAHAATATTTPSGKTVTFTYNGSSTAPSDAGSYSVIGTISDANYAGSASGTLTIAKVPLTVTANANSRVYGGANPAFTATVSGFVNSETASVVGGTAGFSTPATTASPVGNYAITPAAGTLTATNYSFGTFVNGTLAVTKAPLTVTADDKARSFNTANPAFTVSYLGFVSTDNASSLTTQPTAGTTATISSPVGAYPITPSGGVSSNYTFTYVNGTLTVLRVTANDFNGDGKADVLWSNTTSGDRYLWLMNGGAVSSNTFLGNIPPQWTATTGDFNGDGKADILWSNTSTGDRYIWLMNGGSVTASIFLGTIAPQWTPTVADFNGDGKADIFWSNTVSGDRYFWMMNGGSVASSIFLGTVPPVWTPTAADFNGDGKADLLWSNTSSGDRYFWLMNGGSVASSIFLGTVAPQWTPVTGDLNGDGKADILWSNSVSGDRYIWLMNGGSVASSIFLGTIAPAWTATTGDLNGDGKADLLWSNTSSGDRYFWLMNGGSVAGSIFLGTIPPDWHITP